MCLGFRFPVLTFVVWGLGFGVWGLRLRENVFGVQGLETFDADISRLALIPPSHVPTKPTALIHEKTGEKTKKEALRGTT